MSKFVAVPAAQSDVEAISERPIIGQYSTLIQDFIDSADFGDVVEVKLQGVKGTEVLDSETHKKLYTGLKQAARYRKLRGKAWPVQIRSKNSRIFMVKTKED